MYVASSNLKKIIINTVADQQLLKVLRVYISGKGGVKVLALFLPNFTRFFRKKNPDLTLQQFQSGNKCNYSRAYFISARKCNVRMEFDTGISRIVSNRSTN